MEYVNDKIIDGLNDSYSVHPTVQKYILEVAFRTAVHMLRGLVYSKKC